MLHYALLDTSNSLKISFLLENNFSFDNPTKYFLELNRKHNKKLLLKHISNIDLNTPVSSKNNMKNYLESLILNQNDEKLINKVLENSNIIIENNYNALHSVSQKLVYSPKLIEKLIQKGFDVNSKVSITKQTPLMFAITNKDIKKIKILLKYGARVNDYDYKGRNAYDYIDLFSKKEHLKEYFKPDIVKERKIKELLEKYDK